MKYEISVDKAKRLIRGFACLAVKSKKQDKSFEILNFKFIPKALVLELGSLIRYTVETYTFKEEYLKEEMIEITVDFIVKNNEKIRIPGELVIGIDKIQNKGYIYVLPEIVAEKIERRNINEILDTVEGYSNCLGAFSN